MAKKAVAKKGGPVEPEPEFESQASIDAEQEEQEPEPMVVPAEIVSEEKAHLQWIYDRLGALGDGPQHEWMVKLKEIIDGK